MQRPVCRLLAVLFLVLPVAAQATGYEVDTVHSALIFRAKRMGTVYVYGRFNDFSGTIDVPGDDVTRGTVAIEVRTASVDTGNERRDAHLRSADFLGSEEFPLMTFTSKGVVDLGDDRLEVTGDLSLHGVTREVTFTVERVGEGKDPRSGKSLIGFDGSFSIQRSDFGMTFMQGAISDQIDIRLAIHGVGD